MKKRNAIIAILLAVSLMFAACTPQITAEVNIDFIVDGEVYATVKSDNGNIKMPADPHKDGYEFDGWFWDKDVWQKPFTLNSLMDAPLSETLYVYAKLTATENVAIKQGTYITDDGWSYITLHGDNQFGFMRSIATSWLPTGNYVIQDGKLILYVGSDSEPFAVFEIDKDNNLIFIGGHDAALANKGMLYRFIEDDESMTPTTKRHIQKSYIDNYTDGDVNPNDVGVDYYGGYNSSMGYSMVVFIRYGGSDAVLVHETVAGYTFQYPGESYNVSDKLSVLNKGEFYSLTDAYEQGLLTVEDIADIWAKYNAEVHYVEEDFFTITATSDENGCIRNMSSPMSAPKPAGIERVPKGGSVTFSFHSYATNDSHGITAVYVDGERVEVLLLDVEGYIWTYTFEDVNANHTIHAEFMPVESTFWTVIFYDSITGGQILDSVTVKDGDTVSPPAITVKEGYSLLGWQIITASAVVMFYDFSTPVTRNFALYSVIIKNPLEPFHEVTEADLVERYDLTFDAYIWIDYMPAIPPSGPPTYCVVNVKSGLDFIAVVPHPLFGYMQMFAIIINGPTCVTTTLAPSIHGGWRPTTDIKLAGGDYTMHLTIRVGNEIQTIEITGTVAATH